MNHQSTSPNATPRRGFLARAAAAVAAVIAAPSLAAAAPPPEGEEWLQGLTGRHKQFFDAASQRDGRALARVANYLDVYRESYGLKDTDVNAVVGAHGAGLALLLNDAMWRKYELGTRFSENDPATKAPAIRNPYAAGAPSSVERLQQRGVRLLACMRSIRRLGGELAVDPSRADEVRAELVANLLPGVMPVPAMVVAINRAHEAGLAYMFVG
jgi:intracellular sulfur oxidation DsrE/DsrF family protein